MKKKLLTLLSLLGLVFLFMSTTTKAENIPNLEAELNDLIERGIINQEVTLEQYEIAKEEEAEGLAWIEEESRRFEEEQRNNSK